jgi:anti-sigma B factor antagonist
MTHAGEPPAARELNATVEERDGAAVVRPSGDLDIASAAQLRSMLVEPLSRGRGRVVLDLTDVGFMDSSTLGVLVSVHKQANALRAAFSLVSAHSDFQRLFAITGLDRVLRTFRSVDEALAADAP